jgi:hypothetical protein
MPLWNAPSFGTFRAREQRPLVFLIVALSPLLLIPLLILAPLILVLRSVWQKQPSLLWRGAAILSVALSGALVLPLSPLFVGHDVPLLVRAIPIEEDTTYLQLIRPLAPFVNIGLIAELPLIPLALCAAIHTMYLRRKLPNH